MFQAPTPDAGVAAQPLAPGVVIATDGGLALWRHDLSESLWRTAVRGWTNAVVADDETIWYGAVDGQILVCSVSDGSMIDLIACESGQVRCVCGDVVLVRGVGGFEAIDRRRGKLWGRESVLFAATAVTDDAFLIAEESGATVVCLDAITGVERWSIRLVSNSAPRAIRDLARLPSGVPSLTAVDRGILLVNSAGDVMLVDPVTGTLLESARPPFVGIFDVAADGIHFMSPKGFSIFDWRTMAEVEHQPFESEVTELYGNRERAAYGFVATADSIIWSVPHGVLMAVERHPRTGTKRQTWRAEVGGLMPLGVNPMTWGDYMYWVTHSSPHANQPAAMIAFRSAAGAVYSHNGG